MNIRSGELYYVLGGFHLVTNEIEAASQPRWLANSRAAFSRVLTCAETKSNLMGAIAILLAEECPAAHAGPNCYIRIISDLDKPAKKSVKRSCNISAPTAECLSRRGSWMNCPALVKGKESLLILDLGLYCRKSRRQRKQN